MFDMSYFSENICYLSLIVHSSITSGNLRSDFYIESNISLKYFNLMTPDSRIQYYVFASCNVLGFACKGKVGETQTPPLKSILRKSQSGTGTIYSGQSNVYFHS